MRKATIIIALALFCAFAYAKHDEDLDLELAEEKGCEADGTCAMAETGCEWMSRCYKPHWRRCITTRNRYCVSGRGKYLRRCNRMPCPDKRAKCKRATWAGYRACIKRARTTCTAKYTNK